VWSWEFWIKAVSDTALAFLCSCSSLLPWVLFPAWAFLHISVPAASSRFLIVSSSVASQVSFELQTVTLDPSALVSSLHLNCIINRGSGGCLQRFLWTLSLASSLTAVTESTSTYDLKSSNNGSAAHGEMPLHWGGDDVTHSLKHMKNASQSSDSRRCCSSSLTSSQQATKWVSNSSWRDSVLEPANCRSISSTDSSDVVRNYWNGNNYIVRVKMCCRSSKKWRRSLNGSLAIWDVLWGVSRPPTPRWTRTSTNASRNMQFLN